ncbi:Protein dispatched [Aphelenchoides fujianensis]|nr:Protein dispatched [Aphelenchoides fujianensis]
MTRTPASNVPPLDVSSPLTATRSTASGPAIMPPPSLTLPLVANRRQFAAAPPISSSDRSSTEDSSLSSPPPAKMPFSSFWRRNPLHGALDVYTRFLFHRPVLILFAAILLSTVLPCVLLFLRPVQLNDNPEKGFNTRDTVYATPRMAWAKLQPELLRGSRINVHVDTPLPAVAAPSPPTAAQESAEMARPNRTRTKRSWAEDFLNSLGSVACYDDPLPAMDFMAQFVVEVPDLSAAFRKEFLSEMCALHVRLRDTLAPFDQITPHRNIWHVANYAACVTPESRINCTYLTGDDIKKAERLVRYCAAYREEIIDCRRTCMSEIQRNQQEQRPLAVVKCPECDSRLVAANCSSQMMFDLFYRVLPKNLDQRPLYLNAFLPVYTFSAYRAQGYDVPLANFVRLEKRLMELNKNAVNYRLKGMLLDTKRDVLLNAAIDDSRFCLLAVACIVALIIGYTRSVVYCIAVIWQLAASVLAAAAVYRLFTAEFPLLNLIVFVLLISIGSDGAFLLHSSFPRNLDELTEDRVRSCLGHTASTMFLTQFSTVVPFLINGFSAVLAFRTFGLFAGLSLVANYALLISFLPAALLVQRRYIDPLNARLCGGRLGGLPGSGGIRWLRERVGRVIDVHLPAALIGGRFVLLAGLSVWVGVCAWLSCTRLQLPQYNPLQLFVASHPSEFYDNNAERLFAFVEHKTALPLTLRLVWGIAAVDQSAHFRTEEKVRLQADPQFHVRNADEMRLLAAHLLRFRTFPFVQHQAKYWPERFLEWSGRLACTANEVCCNVDSDLFSDTYLDYCMRVSTTELRTDYNDTPLYHNVTFEMVGYTALLPTKRHYSHRFANLSSSFELFDRNIRMKSMWYTTEWGLMSTWYDLQRSIISDSKQSVLVSLLVVLLFAACILRLHAICALISIISIVVCTCGTLVLFGWQIGMLEAIILVLVVSLSFDYTLHYGAAVPNGFCAEHRIQMAVKRASRPVTMAAASSFAAGASLFASQTHAFFQVSVFLLISTAYSLVFATAFFLPLLYIFLPANRHECVLCQALNSKPLPLEPVKQS